MTTLEVFEKFLKDREAPTMYITGVAGTGKTTSLNELLSYCIDKGISALTCAYTHQAVGILKSKLPERAVLSTLHSYLKKRPTINTLAVKKEHVDGNAQAGTPDAVRVLFVDEFSMVGENDYADILALQYSEEGDLQTKVVLIGDPNQLPPVKDIQSITPSGPYLVKLTEIHRQANDNKLVDTLIKINSYLNGEKPVPLEEHETFERGYNISMKYQEYCEKYPNESSIILAYTNAQVEALNAEIQDRVEPKYNDRLFSPTLKKHYTLLSKYHYCIEGCITAINGDLVEVDSKFKTLETLEKIKGVEFYILTDEDGNEVCKAGVFGHGKYQEVSNALSEAAVRTNKIIEKQIGIPPKDWAKDNWSHPLAKDRAKAWKEYMAFKACVICLDFPHAMTVHKSQGSTYDYVFLDTDDIGKCADKDYTMYLKLLYVGISRASKKVYTN